MAFTVWRRHNQDVCNGTNRCDPRCGCEDHRVDDVADMVGTSPKEIRKTYRHWIKEAEKRLDAVRREAWLKMERIRILSRAHGV